MLLRNTIFNLLGLGAPLLVAVVSIPQLIAALGTDRFGLLTLIWAVVSYFGLFDLGLGRALTQQLAVLFSNEEHEKVGPLVATATALMAVLGVVAGALMAAGAHWGVGHIQAVPDHREAINAVYAMALAMPSIVLTSCFRGILEAKHAFGTINLLRFPMGLFTFLGPLAVVVYGESRLDWIAALLATGRLLACAAHAWFAWRLLPNQHGTLTARLDLLKPLCISGGWMTVSNVVSPFMGYVDRLVIAALVSASAVAYYATPLELVIKLSIFPAALTAVLFPALSALLVESRATVWPLCMKALRWLLLAMALSALPLALFANELLSVWIDPAFASHSSALLRVFCLGIAVNCLAHIPFTLLQSAGASRSTAMIHAAELPVFMLALWALTASFGVQGAAFAWLLRILADTTLMFVAACARLGVSRRQLLPPSILSALAVLALGFACAWFASAWVRGLLALLVPGLIAGLLLRAGPPATVEVAKVLP